MKGEEEPIHELRIPKDNELVGIVTKALGASNFSVICSDGNERVCSIPSKLKHIFWIKEGDLVLVKPWVASGDKRGDIIWRYSLKDKEALKERGIKVPE